jgi:hypothetical protein
MTTILIMIIIFAVSTISAAWMIPRKRAARISREAAEDGAIRDLYDHYLVGVDSLTQAYLVQAPSDDEWLAGIREKAAVSARERRWLITAADLGIALYRVRRIRSARWRMVYRALLLYWDDCRSEHDDCSFEHDDRKVSRRNVGSMSLLAGVLTATAGFCVLGRLPGSWLLAVLAIIAPLALGVLAGHAIGLRSWLQGDSFEHGQEGAQTSQIYDDLHGPGGKPGRSPGSTWSEM